MDPVKRLIIEAWGLGIGYGRSQKTPATTADDLLRLLDRADYLAVESPPKGKSERCSNPIAPPFDALFSAVADSKSTPESLVERLSCENYGEYNETIVRFRHLNRDARISAARSYLFQRRGR